MRLNEYLPALYQADPFLERFLLAFEKILLGREDGIMFPALHDQLGNSIPFHGTSLEGAIAHLSTYFDPNETPTEFLSWLAGWVALSLRDDWLEDEKRRFMNQIVPLYQKRGTYAGMIEMLQTYTGGMGVEVSELTAPLQIGVTSHVGVDTAIGGGPPHYFRVKIILQSLKDLDLTRRKQIARAIIDQEKPAHTYYDLEVKVPTTMQVGQPDPFQGGSVVGVNTFLGDVPN